MSCFRFSCFSLCRKTAEQSVNYELKKLKRNEVFLVKTNKFHWIKRNLLKRIRSLYEKGMGKGKGKVKVTHGMGIRAAIPLNYVWMQANGKWQVGSENVHIFAVYSNIFTLFTQLIQSWFDERCLLIKVFA